MNQPAPFDDVFYTALVSLLHRPWFSRLWVLQEVFLAGSRAEVLCADKTMTWESFRKSIFCLNVHVKPDSRVHTALKNAWNCCRLHSYTSLKAILDYTKSAQCSDQRDRVYGVLHLVFKKERLAIQVDYKKCVFDVFRDVLLRYIHLGGNAALLRSCEIRSRAEGIPSWIPNWSIPRTCRRISFPRGE